MTLKIFITGATGYIAGDALWLLSRRHPDYEYALLVRGEAKAAAVAGQYPGARVVLGSLDDGEVLRREAAWADIVLHAADASDHEAAARAIAAGLAAGHSAERPGYWLHTGGTGILTYFDSSEGRLGERSERRFDDWGGVGELTERMPEAAFHRNVDRIVLDCAREHGGAVRTAIVCPPTIYGRGRGPVSGRGRQVYEMARLVLREGYAPIVGPGLARWNNVHVADLSEAYALLVEAAASGSASPEVWGAEAGYHFTENGEHVWGELARRVAGEAQALGYIGGGSGEDGEGGTKIKERGLDKETALAVAGFEAVSWGWNSRGQALRLRKTLGWQPKERSLEEEIPDILRAEKARLEAGQ